MIYSLKTQEGLIYGLIEYEQITQQHILIKYSWIHENYRNNGGIPDLVRMMINDEDTNKTDFVGWERGERGRKIKWYPVHRILRRLYGKHKNFNI